MSDVTVRTLGRGEAAAAGALLHEAFGRAARARGFPPPWATPEEAAALAGLYARAEPDGAVAALRDGALAGVGFARRRGEIAAVGPLAAAVDGQGIGTALLDELLGRAEGWGCAAVRLYQDAWSPRSFALYAGRSFSVVDVVARLERPAGAPPRLDASRGVEIAPFRREDLPELAALDLRLTGLERAADLEATVRLCARRRGAVVGYLGATGGLLGPALALDVADLGALCARFIADAADPAVRSFGARLSTAAPTAMLAAMALGFHVVELGLVMSRGPAPTARPPQLYSIVPEVL